MSGLLENLVSANPTSAPPPAPSGGAYSAAINALAPPMPNASASDLGKAPLMQPIPNATLPGINSLEELMKRGGARQGALPPGAQNIPNAKAPPGFEMNPSEISVRFHKPEAPE